MKRRKSINLKVRKLNHFSIICWLKEYLDLVSMKQHWFFELWAVATCQLWTKCHKGNYQPSITAKRVTDPTIHSRMACQCYIFIACVWKVHGCMKVQHQQGVRMTGAKDERTAKNDNVCTMRRNGSNMGLSHRRPDMFLLWNPESMLTRFNLRL